MSSYFNNYLTGAGQHSPLGASPPFSPQYGDPTSPVSATNNGPLSPDGGLRSAYSSYERSMDIHGVDMSRSHTNINNNNYFNNHPIKVQFNHNRNGSSIGGINSHGYNGNSSSVTGGKSDLASLPCSEPFTGHRLPASSAGGGRGPAAVSPPPVLQHPQQQQLHRQQSTGIETVSSPSPPSTASPPQPRNSSTPLSLSVTAKHRNSTDHPNTNNNKSSSSSHSNLQSPGLQSPGGSSKGDGDDNLESSGKSASGESPGRHGHSDDTTGEGGEGSSKAGFEVYPWMRSQFGKHNLLIFTATYC